MRAAIKKRMPPTGERTAKRSLPVEPAGSYGQAPSSHGYTTFTKSKKSVVKNVTKKGGP